MITDIFHGRTSIVHVNWTFYTKKTTSRYLDRIHGLWVSTRPDHGGYTSSMVLIRFIRCWFSVYSPTGCSAPIDTLAFWDTVFQGEEKWLGVSELTMLQAYFYLNPNYISGTDNSISVLNQSVLWSISFPPIHTQYTDFNFNLFSLFGYSIGINFGLRISATLHCIKPSFWSRYTRTIQSNKSLVYGTCSQLALTNVICCKIGLTLGK